MAVSVLLLARLICCPHPGPPPQGRGAAVYGGASPTLRGFLVYIHLERSGVCKWQVAVGFIRWRHGAADLLSPPRSSPTGEGAFSGFAR